MAPVVIQDFSRQRRALDDGDFSKYFWSFPVAEAACDKQSFVFLSMHFHHLLYCYCSCFNFQSTKCDFAPVLSEVNSEERCVIRWPWWLLCESVFILEIQVSLSPDCIDHSFPLLTDPSHEKLSPVNGLLVVQYSMYYSIYFVMFGCGHQCFVLLTPTTTLIQWVNISQTLGPSHALFIVTCTSLPPWVIGAHLALQKVTCCFLLIITYCIGHWSVGGVGTVSNMLTSVYKDKDNPMAHLETLDHVRCHHKKNMPLVAHSMMSKISGSQWQWLQVPVQ